MNKFNLFILCIFLSPVQFFFIRIGRSALDISVILEFIILIYFSIKGQINWNKLTFFSIYIFFTISFINYLFNPYPLKRLLSSSFFLLIHSLFLSGNFNSNILPNLSKVRSILTNLTIFLSILIILEKLIIPDIRPEGPFNEPSSAGLFLISYICAEFASREEINANFTNKHKLSLVLSSIAFVPTLSTHLFSGFGSLLIYKLNKVKLNYKIKLKSLIGSLLIIILFAIVFSLNSEHILSRLNFFGELNLSQLAWLQGATQALHVLSNNPLFGFGAGSTGQFYLNNIIDQTLDTLGWPNLGRNDGFSGLFRLTIETGLIGLSFIFYRLIIIKNQIKLIRSKANEFNLKEKQDFSDLIFISVFGFTIFMGILLREAIFSTSFYPLCIILLFILPQKYKKLIN